MSKRKKPPSQRGKWRELPTTLDANGNRIVVMIRDGKPTFQLVADLVLEAFCGPRPAGHVASFKDGDKGNCRLGNLEWAPDLIH
jgi:hypothetical protein